MDAMLFLARAQVRSEAMKMIADGSLDDPSASQFLPAERHKKLYADAKIVRRPNALIDRLEGKPALTRKLGDLPPLSRAWEEKGLRHKIHQLRAAGWSKWEAANLSAWSHLGLDPLRPNPDVDLSTDWSVYVLNRLAVEQLTQMGVGRFAL